MELDEVRCEPNPADHSKVDIFLDYRVKATNDRRNLVYPFYVIPSEPEG